jgi:hypothetical protein
MAVEAPGDYLDVLQRLFGEGLLQVLKNNPAPIPYDVIEQIKYHI